MSRALCLWLCISSFAFSQNLGSVTHGSSSSTVQVVYVMDGLKLITYDVDPVTLQASQAGSITLQASNTPALAVSPNGRFLYYSASSADQRLYVYDTNASGVPNARPVQTVVARQLLGNVVVHPNGQFLYSVAVGPIGAGPTANYVIVRNAIDQTTGKISQPITEASYALPDYYDAGYCWLTIMGFNPAGTTLYDAVYCTYPEGTSDGTYNQLSVDPNTGTLGPSEQIYGWNYYAASGRETVQFQNNLMFDFVMPATYPMNQNSLNVYQAQSPLGAALISCGASMLTICSDFQYGLAHPSGQYVFFIDPANVTDIGQVQTSSGQIVLGGTLPYNAQEFSPEGTIVYGSSPSAATEVEISGFNAGNGQVTPGGTMNLPSASDLWVAAERY